MSEANNHVAVTCTSDSLLICISNIACTEQPSVEWNFSGKTIIIGGGNDERVQMDVVHNDGSTNYTVILRINKVTAQDFGEYTCILRNSSVQIKKKIRISQQFMQQITGDSETSKDVIKVKKSQKQTEKDVDGSQRRAEEVKAEKKPKKTKRNASVAKKSLQNGNGIDMDAEMIEITVATADADKKLSNFDGAMISNPERPNYSQQEREESYIKIKPQDQIINTGETMRVECYFRVKPSQFTWYRGIIPVKLDPRATISFDEKLLQSTFELSRCKTSDEAKYSVQVEDCEGESSEIATFTLTVREPENCRPAPTQTHRQSRRMSTIDLSRSTQRFSRMTSLHLPGSDTYITPVIDQVYSNPEMEIFRQRRLTQQMTRRRNSLAELIPDWPTLDYIEKPEYRMPEFKEDVPAEAQSLELRKMDPAAIFKANHWIEELQDIAGQEKEPKVEFICRYSERNVKPQWFKNTSEIFHGHKYSFISEDGLFRLMIQRIAKEDSGKYTCQADDKQTSAYLSVKEKKIEYTFTKKLPANSTVKEKQNFILECMLSDPRPMVIWSKNGETIEYTPEMFEISRREDRCILKMKNVRQDLDGAEFACEVNGDKTICRINVAEPEYEFVRHLNDVDSYENETAEFECEMNYDDVPDLQWFHIDSLLNLRSSKFQYLKDGFKHQLKVMNVSFQDEGLYSCTIQNKVSIAKLFVAPDVVIVERLKNLKKVENDSVKMQCKVNNPRGYSIEWFKDGLPMTASDVRFEVINKDGRVQVLHIKSLCLSDGGVYMCKIGERQTSAKLQVDECCKPPCVSIDFVPRQIKVKAGRSIEVDIPYTGTPIPVMKWLKNGQLLSSGSGVHLTQSLENCSVQIATATRADSGEYELVLSNESGVEQVSITVIVEDKPLEPEGPLQVMDVFKDRCHLCWEPPNDDGNLGIDYYLVEAQDIDRWIAVGKVQGDTQCGIPNLEVGNKYMFRVKAINAAGESQPLYAQKEVLAKDPWDPPSKPGRPETVDFDSNQAEIHWEPSLNDGGSPIQKYVIEKRLACEPWETVGMVHPRDTYAVIPDLLEGKDYEFRVCAVNEAGRGEFSFTSPVLRTKATRVPPKIERSNLMSAVKLKTGQDLVLDVKYSGEPKPVVKWTKANQEMCSVENITDGLHSSELVIRNAQPTDASRYQMTVGNKYGTDSVQIDVFIIDVPSRPTGPLMVTDTRKNSAVLHWKPPENDGGRPIMGYVIEKMNTSTGVWERASNSVPCTTTHLKVSKLVEGVCYIFRIKAENDQGLSQPLVTETETKAETSFTVPGPPRNPVVITNEINHVCITWEEPLHDGGSAVTGYHVERKEHSVRTWTRLNDCPISTTEFTDDKVRSNREYGYRIIAENEAGESQYSCTSIPVRTKSAEEKPFLDATWVKDIVVKVNQDCTFLGLMRGCPTPTVIWYHNGQKIDNSERCQIKTTEDSISMRINKVVKSDAGQYTVCLTNLAGSIQTTATVSVIGPPGQPVGPLEIVNTSPDSITLRWKLPKDDGGLPIERFILEKRQDSSDKWQKVASSIGCKETKVTARNLMKGSDYDFRLVAVNEIGESDPLKTSAPVKAEFPFKPPSKPGVVDCVKKTDSSITLSWTAPTDDGGSSILGYVVQKREEGSNSWTRAFTGEVIGTELIVENLCENKEYDFRVAAINDAGPSEYALTPSSIKLLSTSDVPDAPRFLKAEKVFNGDIMLNWMPPIYSGGSCITQYVIEMLQPSSAKDWFCWAYTRFTQVTISQLSTANKCEFRIRAENIFGQSIPCQSVSIQTDPAKRINDTLLQGKSVRSECKRSRSVEPTSTVTRRKLLDDKSIQEVSEFLPSFSFPLRDRLIQEGNGVKLIACVDGVPQPKIQWLKDGEALINSEKYMKADSFGVCSLEISCCRLNDTGNYVCRATNIKGSTETACHITVEISSSKFTTFAYVAQTQTASSARKIYKMFPIQYSRKPRKSIAW